LQYRTAGVFVDLVWLVLQFHKNRLAKKYLKAPKQALFPLKLFLYARTPIIVIGVLHANKHAQND
jgi:hypothetical protein